MRTLKRFAKFEKSGSKEIKDYFKKQSSNPDFKAWLRTLDAEPQNVRSFVSDQGLEWNPISQRIVFYPRTNGYGIDRAFDQVYSEYFGLFSSIHEIQHVLILEPFFIGSLPIRSYEKFENLYFTFESTAVWHLENILAPTLKARYPDKESWCARSGVTQKNYSHRRALQSLNLSQKEEMKAYVSAFLGRESAILKSNEIFCQNLAARFYSFHLDSIAPLKLMYKTLKRYFIFDVFYKRFCCIEGLPTFLEPGSLVDLISEHTREEYCFSMFTSGLKKVEKKLGRISKVIKIRRKIQTRAYFAHTLLCTLNFGEYFSLKTNSINTNSVEMIKEDLKTYLECLEVNLKALSKNGNQQEGNEKIAELDKFYTQKIRNPLRTLDLWISQRSLFLRPNGAAQTAEFGLMKENLTAKDSQNITALFFAYLESQKKEAFSNVAKDLDLILMASQNTPEKVNQFLKKPNVAKLWSCPLWGNHPEKNNFNEITLLYG